MRQTLFTNPLSGGELSWQLPRHAEGCRFGYSTMGGYKSDAGKAPALENAMLAVRRQLEQALDCDLARLNTEVV